MFVGIVEDHHKNMYDYIFPDLSHIIIPFSEIFKKHPEFLIYNGTEQIPFNEKEPEFVEIMKKEFL